jgi:hypothetical protein
MCNTVAGFSSLPPGDISNAGYNITKWGNVVMTRLFANATPSTTQDGVKSFGLAPWFVETKLAE